MPPKVEIISHPSELEVLEKDWINLQWNPYHDLDWLRLKYRQRCCKEVPYVIVLREGPDVTAIIWGEIVYRAIHFQIGYKLWKGPPLKTLVVSSYGVMGNIRKEGWSQIEPIIERDLIEGRLEAVLFRGFAPDQFPHTASFPSLPWPCKFRRKLLQEHWFIETSLGILHHKMKHKSFWKHVRNLSNRAKRRYQINVERYPTQTYNSLTSLLEETEAIAKRTWQRRFGGVSFLSEEIRTRYEHFSGRGHLKAYLLKLDNEPAAFAHGMEYRGTFFWEFTGYDPRYKNFGPGTILTSFLMKEWAENVTKEVDCGVGNSEAKRLFADRFVLKADRFLVAPGLNLMVVNACRVAVLNCHLALKGILRRCRLYTKIRSAWRRGLL